MPLRTASLTLLITVLAATAWLPGSAQAKVPSGFVGVAAEDVFIGNENYRTTNLSSMSSIGVQSIRQTFDWAQIERARGRYDLSFTDNYVAKAAAHGITIVPVLFNTPLFHAKKRRRRPAYPPRSNRTMAAFARRLVRRYGPKGSLWRERPRVPKRPIRFWQIWNEANLRIYWGGRPSARQYVGMLKTVGGAIKRADRGAQILTAGLPPSKLRGTVPLTRFIKQIYRAGGKRYFNHLAVNSYARNAGELRRIVGGVRRIMNGRGARDRRAGIWITEIGWGDRGPRHRFIVGARGQASRITSALRVIRKYRRRWRLRGLVYFSWKDLPPYAPAFRDQWGLHTGLLNRQGQPKPAFQAFKAGVSRLR